MKEADLIKGLISGDSAAKSAIKEHIGIIVRNWCRKNKIEISWIMLKGKIESEKVIYNLVFTELETSLRNSTAEIKTFNDYKDFVITRAGNHISERFHFFKEALMQGRNHPWQVLDKTMWKYMVKWFSDRKIFSNTLMLELHCQSLTILFEKLRKEDLHFTTSCELKSYYFRILELKWKEMIRDKLKNQKYTHEFPDLFVNNETFRSDKLIRKIKEYFQYLEPDEQYILKAYYFFEKKLSEIAADLEISAENCRVIKHRALRKLTSFIPHNLINDYS